MIYLLLVIDMLFGFIVGCMIGLLLVICHPAFLIFRDWIFAFKQRTNYYELLNEISFMIKDKGCIGE